MDNLSAALPLVTKALAIAQRLHGSCSEHATTLMTKSNLAMTHKRMGSHELALPMYIEVLEIEQQVVVGSDDRSTLVTMGNIAVLHDQMGNTELALPLHREAPESRRRVLGSLSASGDTLMDGCPRSWYHARQRRRPLPRRFHCSRRLSQVSQVCTGRSTRAPAHTCQSQLQVNEQKLACKSRMCCCFGLKKGEYKRTATIDDADLDSSNEI